MKRSFYEFWTSRKEKEDYVKKSNQLKLSPSQLTRLLGDSGVRDALVNSRLAPLLPPAGTDVFRPFTPASLEKIEHQHNIQEKRRRTNEAEEEHVLKPAPELAAEKTLPFFYGDPPPELLSTPLEDLDPYYQSKKTFIVLSKGKIISRFDAGSVCLQLSPFSLLRRLAIKTLNHSLFQALILVALLFNCVLMVFEEPPPWTYIIECVFVGIFILEAVIKIMSRGFCVGSFTYIRDPWNWLDLIIITLGLVNLVFHLDLRMFPTVSAPRILKIIPLLCDLKKTIGTVLQFLKKLTDVFILILFFVTVIAMIGLHTFMGSLRNKCIMALPPRNLSDYVEDANQSFDFKAYINNNLNQYHMPGHLDPLLCGNRSTAGICPEGYTCIRGGENPNYGYTSFDNFGWSLLSACRLLTMDFWENLAMLVMRADGKPALLFFIITFFICSFALVALFLATVAMMFIEREEATIAEAKQKQEDFNEILRALREDKDSQRAEEEDIHKDSKTDKTCGCPACCSATARLLCRWNCCSCWKKVKQGLYVFVNDPFFDLAIIITLIINCIFMAMVHYPMTYGLESMLAIGELAFLAIYTAEVLLKIIAMDPYNFFQREWNIFDSIVVLLAWINMVVDSEVLYLHRALRVVRLARWWGSFSKLLRIVRSGFRTVWTLALVLVVFFFCLTGMTLFQDGYSKQVCRIAQDCELPRYHMADFFHTFMIVTRALNAEWVEVLWDCMEVSGIFSCLVYFIFLKIIGHLIVLGLFLYLLTSWFSSSMQAPEEEKMQILKKRLNWVVGPLTQLLVGKKNQDQPAVQSQRDKKKKEYVALTFVPSDEPVSELKDPTFKNGTETSTLPIAEAEKLGQKVKDSEDDPGNTPENCCSDKCYSCCPLLDIDTSQGIGRVWSIFRKTCFLIVQHRYFENILTFIIILSSFFLVFEDIYLVSRETLKEVVDNADKVFTYLFVLEVLLKWVAHGFRKYFTNGWCCFDFIVTILLLISTSAEMAGVEPSLRYLRALRPLRVLSHIQGTKLSVVVLLRFIPAFIDILLVSLTVWLVFSILGVNLFAGKFYYCFNETAEEYFEPNDVNNKTECLALIEANFTEIRWKNTRMNFDNVENAYLALLQVATFKGFFDIWYAAADSTAVESQPKYEENLYVFVFFVLFQIFGCFFIFNFIVKALFDAYKQQREKFGRTRFFLTEKQKKFYNAVKKLSSPQTLKHPPRPENKFRGWIYDLVTRPCFEVFMVLVICVTILFLLIESYHMSWEMEEVMYWLHFVSILIFTVECILKIIAFRGKYFSSVLNVIDFLVTVISIIGVFLSDLMFAYILFYHPHIMVVFRLGRIGRILHRIPGTKRIQMLLTAFMMSLPSVFNIGLVLFIIMYTFTSFATFHFGYVKKGAGIDDMYNFETFGNSIIMMCFATTWAGWDGMLLPMLTLPPDCDPLMQHPGTTVTGDCGKPRLAVTFFVTYLVVSSFLLLNMFITVIMEVLNTFAETNRDPLTNNNLKMFYKTWKKFDPDATHFIDYSKLSDFCNALQDPLRIPKPNSISLIHMDLPLHPGDKIHCQDILFALSAQVMGESAELDSLKDTVKEKFQMFMANNPCKESCEPISSTQHRKQEEVAAAVIQRAFRKRPLQQPVKDEEQNCKSLLFVDL